ncbi:hypothetical protein RHO13_01860 [Orbus wheelerorum]|uniref:hypothetical protein n=1 Tax=Orbus wheelerorum TaxID=3074111 RepID=UPI00370D74EF
MTKLTKQEIEKKRKEFEKINSVPDDCIWTGISYTSKLGTWAVAEYKQLFNEWLARAELAKGE